jgi:dihydroorotate dehydrogenase (fumarate)
MVDLRTRYLGLDLDAPLVASAGPLTGRLDTLRQLEEAGAGAVVLPSLFEEDIVTESHRLHELLSAGVDASGEAETYLAEPPLPIVGPQRHVQLVRDAKAALRIPVIASVNGVSPQGWADYPRLLVDAGADAIELNVYTVAADFRDTADAVEDGVLATVAAVREAVGVPIAVKVSPYYSAFRSFASRLAFAGADAIVCFNRFYQPDLDLEALAVTPTLELSTSADLRLPLRWIALLAGRVECELACSGGVHTGADAVKAVLAGADVVMTTSAVLRHGPAHIGVLRDGLAAWLAENEYASVAQARGSLAQHSVPDPDAYERANYRTVIQQGMHRWLNTTDVG